MRSLLLLASLTGCIDLQIDVVIDGDGSGEVVIDDGVRQFRCSETCSLDVNRAVTLTPTSNPGSTFIGWSGDACSGTEACTPALGEDTTIVARFDIVRFEVTVDISGTGNGVVLSTDDRIACGTDCSETYLEGDLIQLKAVAQNDSRFVGWTGNCSPTGTSCLIDSIASAHHVGAIFTARNPQLLTITRSGAGSGTVTSLPSGIDCGTECSAQFDMGATITLTATALPTSMFTGWTGGGCSGTGTCTTTLAAATTIDAAFESVPYPLTVTKSGTGAGTVTSSLAGINCGADCTESYPFGTIVTLTATPATDSTFVGWTAECTGTGTCTVTLDRARDVDATFKSLNDPVLPFVASSVQSMTTDTDGGVYTNWIGVWGAVTANSGGTELGILLPFDEPNTPVVERQYFYTRPGTTAPTPLAIGPSNGGYVPPQILTVVANTGTIKVYMPAITPNDCVRTRFYVGADGSTYHSRADHDYTYSPSKVNILTEQCYPNWGVVGPDLTPDQAMVPAHLARAAPAP